MKYLTDWNPLLSPYLAKMQANVGLDSMNNFEPINRYSQKQINKATRQYQRDNQALMGLLASPAEQQAQFQQAQPFYAPRQTQARTLPNVTRQMPNFGINFDPSQHKLRSR